VILRPGVHICRKRERLRAQNFVSRSSRWRVQAATAAARVLRKSLSFVPIQPSMISLRHWQLCKITYLPAIDIKCIGDSIGCNFQRLTFKPALRICRSLLQRGQRCSKELCLTLTSRCENGIAMLLRSNVPIIATLRSVWIVYEFIILCVMTHKLKSTELSPKPPKTTNGDISKSAQKYTEDTCGSSVQKSHSRPMPSLLLPSAPTSPRALRFLVKS